MPITPDCVTFTNKEGNGNQRIASQIDAYLRAAGPSILMSISAGYEVDKSNTVTVLVRPAAGGVQLRCVYLRALPGEDLDDMFSFWYLASLATSPATPLALVDLTSRGLGEPQHELLVIYTLSPQELLPGVRIIINNGAAVAPGQSGGLTVYDMAQSTSIPCRNVSGMSWNTGEQGYAVFDDLTGEWGAVKA